MAPRRGAGVGDKTRGGTVVVKLTRRRNNAEASSPASDAAAEATDDTAVPLAGALTMFRAHVWVSVFHRAALDPYNRCRRLTVAYSGVCAAVVVVSVCNHPIGMGAGALVAAAVAGSVAMALITAAAIKGPLHLRQQQSSSGRTHVQGPHAARSRAVTVKRAGGGRKRGRGGEREGGGRMP
eukprot:gene9043-47428_t